MIKLRLSPMLISLLLIAVATAVVALLEMWAHFFGPEMFAQLIISFGLVGTMTAIIVAIDYDLPSIKSKALVGGLLFLIVTMVILMLSQIWFDVISDAIFAKLVISDLILLGLVSFALVAFEDFGNEKQLKTDKFVN